MSKARKINWNDMSKWRDKSITLVEGCSPVSIGCDFCWSAAVTKRFHGKKGLTNYVGKFNGRIICRKDRIDEILKRKKPTRWKIWNDLFHKDVPFEFIEQVMGVIEECPQHDFQILTKRPQNMADYFNSLGKRFELSCCPNLWLGVTAENPKTADERIPILLQIPAAVRFVRIEPMLGAIDLENITMELPSGAYVRGTVLGSDGKHFTPGGAKGTGLDQVIVGCESRGKYVGRLGEFETEGAWINGAIEIVKQCKDAGTAVFVKQIYSNGKVVKDVSKFPKELQHQENPKC